MVCVLVDVHVRDLVAGVWAKWAVSGLSRHGARAQAGGQEAGPEAGVLLGAPGQGGAAGPPGHEAGSVVTGGEAGARGRSGHTVDQVGSHPGLKERLVSVGG